MEHTQAGVGPDETDVPVQFAFEGDPEDREVVVRDPRPEPHEPDQPQHRRRHDDADETEPGPRQPTRHVTPR